MQQDLTELLKLTRDIHKKLFEEPEQQRTVGVRDEVIALISDNEPWHFHDIYSALRRKGIKTTRSSICSIMSRMFYDNEGAIDRLKPGVYQLRRGKKLHCRY